MRMALCIMDILRMIKMAKKKADSRGVIVGGEYGNVDKIKPAPKPKPAKITETKIQGGIKPKPKKGST